MKNNEPLKDIDGSFKEPSEALQIYYDLFDTSLDLIGISSIDGKYVRINPSFSRTLGYTQEELLSHLFFDLIHPDDLKRTYKMIQQLVKGKPVCNFMNRNITKNKETKWLEWTIMPDHEIQYVYFIGRDVTESVQIKEQIKESERKFQNLFNNVHGVLCIHDLEGKVIEVNKSGLDVTGYTREEMKAGSLYDLVLPENHSLVQSYLEAIQKDGHASGELTLISKSGEATVWYFLSVIDEDVSDDKFVLTNMVDITERKEMDRKLIRAKEAAEQAHLVKSEFITNMSHEIRTPLNGIVGFTELALNTNLDQTQRQYLEVINQSAVTLYGIINDILDFSKMEGGNLELLIDKIDLEDLLSESINIVSYSIHKKGLEILLDVDNNLPKYIWIDGMRVKQILVNLLGNALKFTPQGEVKLYVRLMETYEDGQMRIRFGVKDTGIGIHPDKLSEIFKAFTQEDGSITRKYGGTGLGLTISNKLLSLAGSRLYVDSVQGEGSDFYFDLDVKVQDEDTEISLEDVRKVLIVDDNSNNRQILRSMLEFKGIEVQEAGSGMKALIQLTEESQFDVIIVDYHMPIMDGIETIRKIKDLQAQQGGEQSFLVMYSSSDDETLNEACDELGVDHRLVKPVRMNKMLQVLSDLKEFRKEKPNERIPSTNGDNKVQFKVLITEDNEINMTLTKVYLKELYPDAQILEARDGKEAICVYREEKPDIIFMDVQMPELNGLEATKIIRGLEDHNEIPIIALTAGSLPGEKEKSLAAGMTDFLTKPVLMKTFGDMVDKWLGKKNN